MQAILDNLGNMVMATMHGIVGLGRKVVHVTLSLVVILVLASFLELGYNAYVSKNAAVLTTNLPVNVTKTTLKYVKGIYGLFNI